MSACFSNRRAAEMRGLPPEELLSLVAHTMSHSLADDDSTELQDVGIDSASMAPRDTTNDAGCQHLNVEVPSLSLSHTGDHASHAGRKQTEEYALSLLRRPLDSTGSVAQDLLENIHESFAILVDSRLYAYAGFLARYTSSSKNEHPAIQKKLEVLLASGQEVHSRRVATSFEVIDTEPMMSGDRVSLPVELHVDMDLSLAYPCEEGEELGVSVVTPGTIEAIYKDSSLATISIELDVESFLTSMMKQASRVISIIAEATNRAFVLPEDVDKSKIETRSASFLAMPPPAPRGTKRGNAGLDLLSKLAAERPIVSPDMGPTRICIDRVPSLDLEDDVSELSPDQCADIIDGVLEDFDDTIFTQHPVKKQRHE